MITKLYTILIILAVNVLPVLQSRELSELHKAHAKRLDRVKSLQHNYRLVKEQLKILEDEQ